MRRSKYGLIFLFLLNCKTIVVPPPKREKVPRHLFCVQTESLTVCCLSAYVQGCALDESDWLTIHEGLPTKEEQLILDKQKPIKVR